MGFTQNMRLDPFDFMSFVFLLYSFVKLAMATYKFYYLTISYPSSKDLINERPDFGKYMWEIDWGEKGWWYIIEDVIFSLFMSIVAFALKFGNFARKIAAKSSLLSA